MAYKETTKISDSQNEVINPSTSDMQDMMVMLLQLLKPLAIVSTGSQRVQMDANIISGTLTGTLNTSVVNSPTVVVGNASFELMYSLGRSQYANAIMPALTF
jgi:hypothetical protein